MCLAFEEFGGWFGYLGRQLSKAGRDCERGNIFVDVWRSWSMMIRGVLMRLVYIDTWLELSRQHRNHRDYSHRVSFLRDEHDWLIGSFSAATSVSVPRSEHVSARSNFHGHELPRLI